MKEIDQSRLVYISQDLGDLRDEVMKALVEFGFKKNQMASGNPATFAEVGDYSVYVMKDKDHNVLSINQIYDRQVTNFKNVPRHMNTITASQRIIDPGLKFSSRKTHCWYFAVGDFHVLRYVNCLIGLN